MEEEPPFLPGSEGMQQAEREQGANAGEQRWGAAVGLGGWRQQEAEAEAERPVVVAAAAVGVVAMTVF